MKEKILVTRSDMPPIRETYNLLSDCGFREEVIGFLEDNCQRRGTLLNGKPVDDAVILNTLGHDEVRLICGIGTPLRKKLIERTKRQEFKYLTTVHPSVTKSEWVEFGEGCIICAGNIFTSQISVGDFSIVNLDCTVGHDVKIGRYTTISPGVHVSGRVTIGDECFIGTGTVFVEKVKVGDRVFIGAGSVVTKDIPDDVLVYGVPAKVERGGVEKINIVPSVIKKYIPLPVKRFIRSNILRLKGINIRKIQQKILTENYNSDIKKIIVFLVPGYDTVNGGILSISSICTETKKLKHIHSSEVFMCTVPGEPLLLRYTKFKNDHTIFSLPLLINYFTGLEEIMIHIPEYAVSKFRRFWEKEMKRKKVKAKVHLNIMLQNIRLLSSIEDVHGLKKFGLVTCTTAHEKYTNLEIRKKLSVPLHKLSVFVSPEQYKRKKFNEKRDIMIVSPDQCKYKDEILLHIGRNFPWLKIIVISGIPYEEYKELISEAKWAITFGEGLDGYFVESVFSGSVAFAVYNSDFFTPDFKDLPTVYPSYPVMAKKIVEHIHSLNNENSFNAYNNRLFSLCKKYYTYEDYLKNIERFYKGEYTYE